MQYRDYINASDIRMINEDKDLLVKVGSEVWTVACMSNTEYGEFFAPKKPTDIAAVMNTKIVHSTNKASLNLPKDLLFCFIMWFSVKFQNRILIKCIIIPKRNYVKGVRFLRFFLRHGQTPPLRN